MSGPRKKEVSMKDIASNLGISINAVSLALNDKVGVSDKTRSLVFKTAVELGYFDGNPVFLGGSISRNICFIIEQKNFEDINFYSKVILGLENEARKSNYDIIVDFMDKNNFKVPSCIISKKARGVLVIGAVDDDYLVKVKSFGLPVVLVDYASSKVDADSVLTQNINGAYKATDYLMSRGHTVIGFFGDTESSITFRERWFGYYERMMKSGVPGTDLECCSVITPMLKFVEDKNYRAIANSVRGIAKMPTAWVCASDDYAIALINALQLLNLNVPDDVSVIGFDDIDLCHIIVPYLTTIRVNKEQMGEMAIKRLVFRIDHREEPSEEIRLAVSLVERSTVADLKKGDGAVE